MKINKPPQFDDSLNGEIWCSWASQITEALNSLTKPKKCPACEGWGCKICKDTGYSPSDPANEEQNSRCL